MLTVSVWLDESLLHFCFSNFAIWDFLLAKMEAQSLSWGISRGLLVHPNRPSHFSEMDLVTTGSSLIFCVWARASRFRCQHWHSLNGFRDVIPLIICIILLLGWHLPELNRIPFGTAICCGCFGACFNIFLQSANMQNIDIACFSSQVCVFT